MGSDAWAIAVVSWPLFPLVQQTNHSQINLPEISFHMRISSIVVVNFIDWRQTAWIQFQLCHLFIYFLKKKLFYLFIFGCVGSL